MAARRNGSAFRTGITTETRGLSLATSVLLGGGKKHLNDRVVIARDIESGGRLSGRVSNSLTPKGVTKPSDFLHDLPCRRQRLKQDTRFVVGDALSGPCHLGHNNRTAGRHGLENDKPTGVPSGR